MISVDETRNVWYGMLLSKGRYCAAESDGRGFRFVSIFIIHLREQNATGPVFTTHLMKTSRNATNTRRKMHKISMEVKKHTYGNSSL